MVAVHDRAMRHLDNAMDEIFIKLAKEFNVKTGDWAPEQQARLRHAQEQIADLMVVWYVQNTRKGGD